MSIIYDELSKTYTVSYSKRHPVTKKPIGLKRKKISSKVEANRVYNELVIKVNEIIKKKIIPTWENFLNDYFENLKITNITNTTSYNRDKTIRFHTLPKWKDKLVDEIGKEDIFQILKSSLGANAESHKKYFLQCLKSVFQFAMDRGLIDKNPTPVLQFKLNDKIMPVLTEEQILILLKRSQELEWEWYPHYAVALFTGLRNGEIYALTWDKVNLETRQIKVDCSWNNRDGFKSTKSGDDRIVEIPKPLLPVLMELKVSSYGSQFVLPRLSKWDKGEQARELRNFLKSIGLPQIRFHDLRASWATLLLSKGVAPSKVMSMGGWKDMETMMIYMRKAGIDIKNATSVLDNFQTHGVDRGQVYSFQRN